MFRAIAALALASTAAQSPTATLKSSAPWWERVTVTVTDDGQTKSCRYESSLQPSANKDCSVVGDAASMTHATSSAKDEVTRITFERRFSPDAKPDLAALQPGDVLLSGQTLALAIDPHGAVKGCKVVETSGTVAPNYGCSDASSEKFDASVNGAAGAERAGYMSVLVYGHSEHVV